MLGLENLFGKVNPFAIIKPFLPSIKPQLTVEFDKKVLELLETHGIELINTENIKQEVAVFGTKRGGEPVISWGIVEHNRASEHDAWEKPQIVVVLEVKKFDDLISKLGELEKELKKAGPKLREIDISNGGITPMNLNEGLEDKPLLKRAISSEEEPTLSLNDIEDFRKKPFAVIQYNGEPLVISGPMKEDDTRIPFAGYDSREECFNWIEDNKDLFFTS